MASGSMEAAEEGAPRANLCPVREGVRAAVEHKTRASTPANQGGEEDPGRASVTLPDLWMPAVERKPVVMSVPLEQPPEEEEARLA